MSEAYNIKYKKLTKLHGDVDLFLETVKTYSDSYHDEGSTKRGKLNSIILSLRYLQLKDIDMAIKSPYCETDMKYVKRELKELKIQFENFKNLIYNIKNNNL
jgi:hypothetical protein